MNRAANSEFSLNIVGLVGATNPASLWTGIGDTAGSVLPSTTRVPWADTLVTPPSTVETRGLTAGCTSDCFDGGDVGAVDVVGADGLSTALSPLAGKLAFILVSSTKIECD